MGKTAAAICLALLCASECAQARHKPSIQAMLRQAEQQELERSEEWTRVVKWKKDPKPTMDADFCPDTDECMEFHTINDGLFDKAGANQTWWHSVKESYESNLKKCLQQYCKIDENCKKDPAKFFGVPTTNSTGAYKTDLEERRVFTEASSWLLGGAAGAINLVAHTATSTVDTVLAAPVYAAGYTESFVQTEGVCSTWIAKPTQWATHATATAGTAVVGAVGDGALHAATGGYVTDVSTSLQRGVGYSLQLWQFDLDVEHEGMSYAIRKFANGDYQVLTDAGVVVVQLGHAIWETSKDLGHYLGEKAVSFGSMLYSAAKFVFWNSVSAIAQIGTMFQQVISSITMAAEASFTFKAALGTGFPKAAYAAMKVEAAVKAVVEGKDSNLEGQDLERQLQLSLERERQIDTMCNAAKQVTDSEHVVGAVGVKCACYTVASACRCKPEHEWEAGGSRQKCKEAEEKEAILKDCAPSQISLGFNDAAVDNCKRRLTKSSEAKEQKAYSAALERLQATNPSLTAAELERMPVEVEYAIELTLAAGYKVSSGGTGFVEIEIEQVLGVGIGGKQPEQPEWLKNSGCQVDGSGALGAVKIFEFPPSGHEETIAEGLAAFGLIPGEDMSFSVSVKFADIPNCLYAMYKYVSKMVTNHQQSLERVEDTAVLAGLQQAASDKKYAESEGTLHMPGQFGQPSGDQSGLERAGQQQQQQQQGSWFGWLLPQKLSISFKPHKGQVSVAVWKNIAKCEKVSPKLGAEIVEDKTDCKGPEKDCKQFPEERTCKFGGDAM